MKFSNDLTDAQLERLAILGEELGEAQQAIGKIIRHGYHSWNPLVVSVRTNKEELEKEVGDIIYALQMLTESGDLDDVTIQGYKGKKADKIKPFLHHQPK